MRRLLVALAVAGLVAGGSGAVAQASGLDNTRPTVDAVLTPDQIGITQPAQGFFPFFNGAGGQNGSNLGGLGLGGVAPTNLTSAALFSGFGGCGVFSISFCPQFSSPPISQTFLLANGGSLGLGSPFAGLGGVGGLGCGVAANGIGANNVGQISAQAVGNGVANNGLGCGLGGFGGLANPPGFGLGNPIGVGGFGGGFGLGGFGTGFGGQNCIPQGAFLICQ
jgi:hypothetical protein